MIFEALAEHRCSIFALTFCVRGLQFEMSHVAQNSSFIPIIFSSVYLPVFLMFIQANQSMWTIIASTHEMLAPWPHTIATNGLCDGVVENCRSVFSQADENFLQVFLTPRKESEGFDWLGKFHGGTLRQGMLADEHTGTVQF